MQYFIINFDFTKPPLVDFLSHTALPTPNNSFIEIFGESENWVSGIFETVQMKIRSKANKRRLLHRPYIYDLLLWSVVMPFTLFWLNRLDPYVTSVVASKYVRIGALVYGFVFMLSIYRVLFGYTKWAFPKLELIHPTSRTSAHRRWWFAILTGVVASIIAGFRF